MTIGERIADLRKKNGFSQEALGERLGVSRQAVSKWESDAALPEIDKLIEMAKLFDVKVGVLLGVEEEELGQQQESGQPEDVYEKAFEKYLAKLSEENSRAQTEYSLHKSRSGKWYRLLAAAVCVCMVIMFVLVANLRREITSLQNQLYNMEATVGSISATVTEEVRNALSEASSILTSWNLSVESADYQNETVVLGLDAVPKETMTSTDSIQFTARLANGEIIQAENVTLDGAGGVTAQIELPIENDIEFYLTINGNVAWLTGNGDDYADLKERLMPTIWADISGGISENFINGTVELWVSDAECEMIKETDSTPEVSLWLMRGEEKLYELDDEKTSIDNVPTSYSWGVSAGIELSAEDLSPALEVGEVIYVKYEVAYSNGLILSGIADTCLVATEDGCWSIEDLNDSEFFATWYTDN